MSYLEQGISYFLKTKIFGGFEKLKRKEYLPFAILVFVLISINTVSVLLYYLNIINSIETVHKLLMLQLFLSFGVILCGLALGHTKNYVLYYLLTIFILAVFVIAFIYLNWVYSQTAFQYIKLVYFLSWVLISCISFYFLTLYFFTSFTKKIITLGIPKNHIFFGAIIKVAVLASIPIYIYLIYEFNFGNLIIALFGIASAVIILFLMVIAPRRSENTPGVINFSTATGFFYVYLLYHLIMGFTSTSRSISSVIVDLTLLLVNMLYIIQSLTRKISNSADLPGQFENQVTFQSKINLIPRLKIIFGEKGLILIVMGIVLGYNMVFLDSFFNPNIPLLSLLVTPQLQMSAVYHRVYLIFSFFIILISWFTFATSNRFRDFMEDKYTVKQAFKYIGGYFQRPLDDSFSPIEYGIAELGKKIGSGILDFADKWNNSKKEDLLDKNKNDRANKNKNKSRNKDKNIRPENSDSQGS